MTTDELFLRFEREYLEMNSITVERRRAQFRLLSKLATVQPLDSLCAGDVRGFIGTELAAGLHPNTARKHLGMIRSFVRWAGEAGILDPVRAAELQSVGNPRGSSAYGPPNPYKTSEIHAFQRLLAEKYPCLAEYGRGSRAMRRFMRGQIPRLNIHLWRHARRLQFEAQIALALEAGLRRIEIYHLSIPALHYDNDEVVVLTAKQGPGRAVRRSIPYTAHARSVMQDWLDFRRVLRPGHDFPWLALAYSGGGLEAQIRPLDFDTFGRSLDRAFGPPWRWHRFRHSAATEWLRAGVPLEKVSFFMGHSSLEQTRAYTEILDSDMRTAFGEAEASFAQRLRLSA